jgi:PAS domain-containing protein
MGVMLDITDQKETELALEQTWRRFETALANTAVVVWQQDLSLRYTWINNARLGYKANAVIGHTDSELMGPELGRPVEAIKRRVIETGRSAHEEVVVQGEQGRATYDLYVEPLHDEHGVVVGITCAAIELSKGERRVVGSAPTLSQAYSGSRFSARCARLSSSGGAARTRAGHELCSDASEENLGVRVADR